MTQSGAAGRVAGGLLRLPHDQRALFEILGNYDGAAGLDALLKLVDVAGAYPRHIYHIAHRRLPDNIDAALSSTDYNARSALAAAIVSDEFLSNIVLNLLHAYPELKRDVMLFAPGVSSEPVLRALADVQAVLRHRLGVADHEQPKVFLDALAQRVRTIAHAGDLIAECGTDLERYIARADCRPRDRLIAVLEDPVRVMVGQANAAVAQLLRDPDREAARTRELLRYLGISRLAPGTSISELRRLAERALEDPRICRPNAMSQMLSHTSVKNFSGALTSAAILDVEITTAGDLPAWLLERFGVLIEPMPGGGNDAGDEGPLKVDEVICDFPDLLLDTTLEDRRLYDVVTWALDETRQHAMTGQQIVRFAGPDMLREMGTAKFVPSSGERFPPRRARPRLLSSVLVQGASAVSTLMSEPAAPDAVVVDFGADGESAAHVLEGWSVVEPEARWTLGTRAAVAMARPRRAGPCKLRIDVTPFLSPPRLGRQRLGLLVNGRAVAHVEVTERSVLEYEVAEAILALRTPVLVELALPDAASPRQMSAADDDRMIAFYVRSVALLPEPAAATPMRERRAPSYPPTDSIPVESIPLNELALLFESIGENCEWGLVQRRWGAEPLGLLRFASSPPDKLLPALRQGFRGMGATGTLEVELHGGREYMVLDKTYGFLYHAWALVGELTPEEILTREHRRVPFLVRKLTEDLEGGEKLFVYHCMRPLAQREAQELATIIRSYGPGTLLWMELADADNPPGSVVRVNDTMIKGHMDRFAPGENAHDISMECWAVVCRNAVRLLRGNRA